jgi:hypothetical protein
MLLAVRRLVLFSLLALVIACESSAEFPVPSGPPLQVALDPQFTFYTEGTWALDGFSEELALQLAKYNMKVVDRRTAPPLVAEINLGVWGNRHVVDVYVVRDGDRAYAGRVSVPDLALPTLDASARLVAPLVARSAWHLGGNVPAR